MQFLVIMYFVIHTLGMRNYMITDRVVGGEVGVEKIASQGQVVMTWR